MNEPTPEPTQLKVVERVTLEKIDCSGETRQIVETIKLVDGVIVDKIIHDPPKPVA